MALNKFRSTLDDLFGIDIRALGAMRIGFAFCILIDLWDHLPYISTFYTDNGLLPRSYALHYLNPNVICLNMLSGSFGFQALLFLLTVIFTIGLLLGFRTRLCTMAVWILLCSLHNRNYFLLGAEDKLLHILLFWFMFLPWGSWYSMDSQKQNFSPPARVSSMATVGLLLQICFFYTFAGLLKTDAQWTTDGTAMYYVMSLHEFAKPLAHSLLIYPHLMHALTIFVLWLERCGAVLFFVPFYNLWFRLAGVLLFAFFHIGILLTMELRLFQWICLIMLIAFLPTACLNHLLEPVAAETTIPPEKNKLFKMPGYLSLFVAFCLVYVLFWNLGELQKSQWTVPDKWRWIGYTLNLDQHWGMFAPRPMTDDGWMVVPGKLRNGQIVDILNDGKPLSWREPLSIPQRDKMYHLTLYYLNIRHSENAYYRLPWAESLCRQWNNTHDADEQLKDLEIDFMEQDILPPGKKPVAQRVELLSHHCI